MPHQHQQLLVLVASHSDSFSTLERKHIMGLRDRAAKAIADEEAAAEQHRNQCWNRNAQEGERLVRERLLLSGKTTDAYGLAPEERSGKRWRESPQVFEWGDGTNVEVVEEDLTLVVKVYVRSHFDKQPEPALWIVSINNNPLGKPYLVASLADVGRAIESHDQKQQQQQQGEQP